MNQPERIYHVSSTQLSIARHYGGIKFNGADYVYDYKKDMLIRGDILAAENKEKQKKKDKAKKAKK